MKTLSLILFSFLCFITYNLSAQTPGQIEDDLLKSFKKIDYWNGKRGNTVVDAEEALYKANNIFALKLKYYTEKYSSSTINYPFTLLIKAHVNIISSTDGVFRIYSWDTETGGTMHFFENVFQYKIAGKTIAVLDTPKMEGDSRPYYDKLYTFKTNIKTYYLVTTLGIGSTKDYARAIKVFSIENGKLNDGTRIIKTKSGLHSEINYEYDLALTDMKTISSIHFDPNTQSIYIPIVLGKGKLTSNYIVYKFTGQYFERVKANFAK